MQTDLKQEIRRLAREKNAIILAHNYQLSEVQDIADLTGDSLALSIQAAKTDADIIVFCGVHFMAETAAILCPNKKVLLPVLHAGCAMADMVTAEDLKEFKSLHSGVPVVTYVNSSAEVKAESYICCTSANAVQVVKSLRCPEVIMTPDKNLAMWTQRHTNQKIHIWEGFCPIHDALRPEELQRLKSVHPNALIIAHPECPPDILDMADVVKSTSGMLEFPEKSHADEFIIATEIGLLYPLQRRYPHKRFYAASSKMVCEEMKKTGLKEVFDALRDEKHVVTVPEEIRLRALSSVERMLAVPRDN